MTDDKAVSNERNILADDATPDQVIATTLLAALPILSRIADSLDAINRAIAPEDGRSVGHELRLIVGTLAALVEKR